VNAVVEIDVSCARFVALDKPARARARKCVRGFVVNCPIRFHLDDDPGAFAPDQFSADKFASTRKRIAPEEKNARTTLFINRALRFSLGFDRLGRWLVINGDLYATFDRFTVAEGRDEFRAIEIG